MTQLELGSITRLGSTTRNGTGRTYESLARSYSLRTIYTSMVLPSFELSLASSISRMTWLASAPLAGSSLSPAKARASLR